MWRNILHLRERTWRLCGGKKGDDERVCIVNGDGAVGVVDGLIGGGGGGEAAGEVADGTEGCGGRLRGVDGEGVRVLWRWCEGAGAADSSWRRGADARTG